MKKLATASIATAALWSAFYLTPMPVPPSVSWYDKMIVYEIAIVFTTAAIVMLISRAVWTIRAIGILFSLMGLGLLFWNAVYVRQSGYKVLPNGRVVPNTNAGIQEGVSDLSRALLIIGGPLLMIGLIGWAYGRFGHFNEVDQGMLKSSYDGSVERRKGIPRRQDDARLIERIQKYEDTYGEIG